MDTEDPRHVVTPFIVVYFSWVFHYPLVQVGTFTLHVTLTYLYYIELCMLYHPGRSVAMALACAQADWAVAKALACAQADWAVAKARGKVVGVMAFDLSTAFDTIGTELASFFLYYLLNCTEYQKLILIALFSSYLH